MYLLLIILIALAAILLSFVVLIQNSKGGGLASNFASSNQIMGVRKTTDFMEKTTWGLAAFIVVLSIMTAYTTPNSTAGGSVLLTNPQENAVTNPLNVPSGFTAPQAEENQGQNAAPQTEGAAAQEQAPAASSGETN